MSWQIRKDTIHESMLYSIGIHEKGKKSENTVIVASTPPATPPAMSDTKGGVFPSWAGILFWKLRLIYILHVVKDPDILLVNTSYRYTRCYSVNGYYRTIRLAFKVVLVVKYGTLVLDYIIEIGRLVILARKRVCPVNARLLGMKLCLRPALKLERFK